MLWVIHLCGKDIYVYLCVHVSVYCASVSLYIPCIRLWLDPAVMSIFSTRITVTGTILYGKKPSSLKK